MAHFEIDRVFSRSADGYKAMVQVQGKTKHLRLVNGEWTDQPNRAGLYNTYGGVE